MNAPYFHSELVESKRILYTPSGFAKINLLHLQEIGELQAKKTHISRRSDLASCLFFMVISGSGTLKYDTREYSLRPGDCVFIDCKRPYHHQTSEDLWNLKWVHFYGPVMSNIYEKYVERGGSPAFTPKQPEKLLSLWEGLYATANSADYIRDMRINEALSSMLTLLMEESWHPEAQRSCTKQQSLMDLKSYLDEHYRTRITLDQLAERFYINKFYLTRVFKTQFGMSINSYLLQLRITHAKQLLRFTDETVEAIGIECGIGPLNYFSRMFKKVEGITPSEYRRQW